MLFVVQVKCNWGKGLAQCFSVEDNVGDYDLQLHLQPITGSFVCLHTEFRVLGSDQLFEVIVESTNHN